MSRFLTQAELRHYTVAELHALQRRCRFKLRASRPGSDEYRNAELLLAAIARELAARAAPRPPGL